MRELALKNGKRVKLVFLDMATTNWAADVTALSRQLYKGSAAPTDREALMRIVGRNRFLVAFEGRDDLDAFSGCVVAMAVLSLLQLPGRQEGIISDFVVSAGYARQGIEMAMANRLIEEALELRLDAVSCEARGLSADAEAALSESLEQSDVKVFFRSF